MNTFIAFLFGIQAVNQVMPAWVLRICFPLETAVTIEHLPLTIQTCPLAIGSKVKTKNNLKLFTEKPWVI